MALDIPLPTAQPNDDPLQFIPLLLSAIGEFLQSRDIWAVADYDDAYNYMEALKGYIVDLMTKGKIMNVGLVEMWFAAVPPDGWLILDGSAISRSTYAQLFALWGETFGVGDGTTTFNLPNFEGRSPMGVSGTLDIGEEGGEAEHTLSQIEMPSHFHTLNDPGHIHTIAIYNGVAGGSTQRMSAPTGNTASNFTVPNHTTGITMDAAGSSVPHNNIHPVLGVHMIVWTGVN